MPGQRRKVILIITIARVYGQSREETQQVYQKMLECTDIAFLTLDDEDALWGQKQPVERGGSLPAPMRQAW